jgi:hypothetical protein
MFVGEKNAVELLRCNACCGQPVCDAFGAEAGVDQHAGGGGFNEGAIA